MEVNQINNRNVKEKLAGYALNVLESQKLITEKDYKNLSFSFGYLFSKEDGVLEGLYKVSNGDNIYYFAVQNDKIMLVEINEEMYNQTISYMTENHECLKSNDVVETEVQKNRREKNYNLLKRLNITAVEKMPCLYDDNNVKLKDTETIVKKIIATFFAIQVACDINNDNYEESIKFFKPLLKAYKVEDCLNDKEKRIFDGTYSKQDAIDMDWAYEIYWSICWALGLVDDITNANRVCDCDKAIEFVQNSKGVEDFISKCKVRSISEILDMQDLYYRYNWAINEKKVNKNASIDNLDPSNVIERRRGLEWILSDEEDWYNINMSA